jgi:murein DD-endopeptidase MepM/ murein hydrolase activator NlpD
VVYMSTPEPGTYVAPLVERFPVCIPPDFKPVDLDKDGIDQSYRGRDCPGYDPENGFEPKSGGGFGAKRKAGRHRAWDIMAAEGAPIVSLCYGAVAVRTVLRRDEGPVSGLGYRKKGGNYLVIIDQLGTDWYLAHLAIPACVEPGQELVPGQHVGYVGRTGNAHYHSGKRIIGCPHIHLRGRDRRGVYFPPERHLLDLLKGGGWKWRPGWARPALLEVPKDGS